MNQELQQSVGDVVNRNVNVASGLTAGTGALTILQVVPEVLGCISMTVGIAITIYFSIRKKRLYDRYEAELDRREDNEKN